MIHNEHFRKADDLYEIWHDDKGNAIHIYIKDGEAIIFPTLYDMVMYTTTGDNSIERTYLNEDRLSEIPDTISYNYYAIRDWIAKGVLEDTFVTAMEGGSNYWLYINRNDIRDNAIEGKSTAESLLEAVLNGKEINVYDVNGDDLDEPIGKLSAMDMSKRITNLMQSESYGYALYNMMNGDYDANDADIVFQYLALGEVVYG